MTSLEEVPRNVASPLQVRDKEVAIVREIFVGTVPCSNLVDSTLAGCLGTLTRVRGILRLKVSFTRLTS